MEYHLKFKNGRSCEIECESTGTPLQDKINRAEERFGSPVATINGKAVKEHGLGGFILGTILGGAVASNMTKPPKKKSPTPKVKTFKSSSTSKSGRAKDRKYVNADEDYETRYSKDKPARKGYGNRDVMNLETMAKGGGVYSSDEMYVLKVYDLNGKLLDTKRFQERNIKRAKEFAIDMFEYDMQQKHGSDLRFSVELAPAMAKGGKTKEVIEAEKELKKAKASKISSYIDEASKKLDTAYEKEKYAKGGGVKVGGERYSKEELQDIKFGIEKAYGKKFEDIDKERMFTQKVIYHGSRDKNERMYSALREVEAKKTGALAKGGSTDRDDELKHELNEFLQDPDGDGFGIFGYTNRIHEIMMGRDDEYKPSELDEYLKENDIYGYTSRIKRIYDEKYADGGYVGTGGTMDSSMGDAPTIGGTMASSMYAKGGLSEHGLKKGDYILNDLSEYDKKAGKNLITVIDKKDHSPHMVNLNEGIRYAKGGEVAKGFKVFNYTDNLYASDEVFKTKKLANEFIKEFRNRFAKQGYYRDNRMRKIAIKDIDLLAIPSDFNPFRQYAKGGKAEPDTYFSKLYNPNTNLLRDGKVIDVEYKSSFNYDISIEFKYNSKGERISAKVIHEIKEWEYDLSEATEIGGFENNADDFHKLAEITDNVIKSNLDVYKQILKTGKTEYGYYDTKPLDTKLISALETLYKSWGAKQNYAKGGSIVSDEQQAKDNNFLKDVIYTLSEEGLTIDGKELSREEATEYVLKHASKLIALGRDGWNPFDAVYIVEGHPEETDIPEKAMKYAEGGSTDDTIADRYARLTETEAKRLDELQKKVEENEQTELEDAEFDRLVRKYRGWDKKNTGYAEGGSIYATGGMIGKEIMYNYYGEKKIGTITEILPSGDYVVHAGFGQRSVSPSDVISEMETKKKRFGFFKSGGLSDTPKKGYDIVGKTMHEFKQGKLRSSSGDIVTDREQALAIALSKERRGYFKEGGMLDEYHESKYLTKEQWERWNEWVKTGKINGKKEDNMFAVAGWVGKSISNINAYEIEQRSKKLKMRTGGSLDLDSNVIGISEVTAQGTKWRFVTIAEKKYNKIELYRQYEEDKKFYGNLLYRRVPSIIYQFQNKLVNNRNQIFAFAGDNNEILNAVLNKEKPLGDMRWWVQKDSKGEYIYPDDANDFIEKISKKPYLSYVTRFESFSEGSHVFILTVCQKGTFGELFDLKSWSYDYLQGINLDLDDVVNSLKDRQLSFYLDKDWDKITEFGYGRGMAVTGLILGIPSKFTMSIYNSFTTYDFSKEYRYSEKFKEGGLTDDYSEYLNYLDGEDLETMKAYIESKNPKRVIGKDRYENDVRIGDAIHIRILTGRYGQTKDYEGIVTDYDKFGNVELDGQRKVRYTANYVHNDYEHGHHIWAEKIDPKDIRDSLRVPKKFVPTFSSRQDVYGEAMVFKGTEKEFRDYLDSKFPGNVFGQWFPLYNLGWRIDGDNYFSPDHKKYDGFSFYESVEQGQGHLNMLLIPKSEKRSKNEKMAKGGVTYPDLSKEKPDDIIQDQGTLFEVEPKEKEKITKIPEVDLTIEKNEFFKNLPKVNSSESAVNILRKFWDKAQINVQEYFYVLLLSQNNKPISVYHQSKGGVASTIADVELTCAVAVKSLARAVIIAHNHPSGELRFSEADKQLTVKLAKALKTLDIALLDSMIVTDESYLSMADEGQLPTV